MMQGPSSPASHEPSDSPAGDRSRRSPKRSDGADKPSAAVPLTDRPWFRPAALAGALALAAAIGWAISSRESTPPETADVADSDGDARALAVLDSGSVHSVEASDDDEAYDAEDWSYDGRALAETDPLADALEEEQTAVHAVHRTTEIDNEFVVPASASRETAAGEPAWLRGTIEVDEEYRR
jgi:hypothetical protein